MADATQLDRAKTALRAMRQDGIEWGWIDIAAQHVRADEMAARGESPTYLNPQIVDLHGLTTAWRQPMPGSPRA